VTANCGGKPCAGGVRGLLSSNVCRWCLAVAVWGWLWVGGAAQAADNNLWPALVERPADSAGRDAGWSAAGPFVAWRSTTQADIFSLRPLFTRFDRPAPQPDHWHVLYPLFNYYKTADGYHWNLFNLIDSSRAHTTGEFRLTAFPFVFARSSPVPDTSHFAVWPVGGTIRNFFGRQRIDFAAWPLWIRSQRGDETWYHFPYPFLRRMHGPSSSGFAIWPLYGQSHKEGSYHKTFALWPVFYHHRYRLSDPEPVVHFGIWPLYTAESAPGLRSRSFVWPFFGYTREYDPRPPYTETRWFWPFVVQGRGDERHVNRLLPVYAHEASTGYRKNWYLWPVLRTEQRDLGTVLERRNTLLYFVWQDIRQQAHTGSYHGRKTWLWPLFGYWADGSGDRQFQLLDPLGTFFPHNEKVRENWSPLFAIYRYDHRAGSTRHSLLWDLVVWQRTPDVAAAFHLGPLFEWVDDGPAGHWQLFKGLFGVRRLDDGSRRLRLLWINL
jgi:hypothetical protein